MKVGDLVVDLNDDDSGVIVAVGYSEKYRSTDDSPDLWPDIYVIADDGKIQRWNSKHTRVINEDR